MAITNESMTIINYSPKRQKIQSIQNRSHEFNINKSLPQRYLNIQLLPDSLISQQIHQSPLVRFNHRLLKCLKEKAAINFSLEKQLKLKSDEDSVRKTKDRYKKSMVQESKTNETTYSLQMTASRDLKVVKKRSLMQKRSSQKKSLCKIQCINYPIINERERNAFKRNILTKSQQQSRMKLIERIFSKNLIKTSTNNKEYHTFKRYSYDLQHPYSSLIKPKFDTEPLEENHQVVDNFAKNSQGQMIIPKDNIKNKCNSIRFMSIRQHDNDYQQKHNNIKNIQPDSKFNKFQSYKRITRTGDENEQFGPWAESTKRIH